uniref:Response regulator n=1 Tax=uncultured bacterium contig00059 TaxID=1181542 RepID=A0A0A6ZH45_9BACT|nr:response regulator [uncultured bacterium contig00059]
MKTIFVVDDNDVNLLSAYKALAKNYRVFTLPSAAAMFELLENVTPDLILLDIEMSEMDGLEALKFLKSSARSVNIPVMFLTGRKDEASEILGFELGAVDFITKPFSDSVLLKRVNTHLGIDSVSRERMSKLKNLQTGIVSILANMVENRDTFTGRHIERTTRYIRILINGMLERGVYAEEINQWNMETVVSSVRLHDIGKIVISDLLLNKRGKLTDEEFEIMKTHAPEGEKIIESIIVESGDGYFLQNAKLFAGYHHERWDGTGYPRGLSGEAIPLQGRIMAIADVYDALVSERPYKPAYPHETAVEIISKGSGGQFDPKIADVFMKINGLFAEVAACQ